jgi:hypothetical protein
MLKLSISFLGILLFANLSCSKKSSEPYGENSIKEPQLKSKSTDSQINIEKELEKIKNQKPRPKGIEKISLPFTIEGFNGKFVDETDGKNRFIVSGKISLLDLLIRRFQLTVKVSCLENSKIITALFAPISEVKNGELLEIPFFKNRGLKSDTRHCEIKFGYENSLGGNRAVNPLYYCVNKDLVQKGKCLKSIINRKKIVGGKHGIAVFLSNFKVDNSRKKGILDFTTQLYSNMSKKTSHKVTVLADGKQIHEQVFTYSLRNLIGGESRRVRISIDLKENSFGSIEFIFTSFSIFSKEKKVIGTFCFIKNIISKGNCKKEKA